MIKNGKKVQIHYTLTVEGEIVDSSSQEGPLEYEHGTGQIIPGLEKALEGLSEGDKKQVYVGCEDAYGPKDPQAIIDVPKDRVAIENIEPGMGLQAVDSSGKKIQGIVMEVGPDKVKIDFNHPLAGKELQFDVEIVKIF